MHNSVQKWLMAAALLSILFGSGCGRDSIKSYRVPKAWSESAVPTQAHQGADEIHSPDAPEMAVNERSPMNGDNGAASMRMLPGMQESLDAIPDATWEAPSHWEDTGPRPGRKGSYALSAPGDGKPADFSISALAGDAGGIPANVNRWRRQIGLPPWSPNEIRQEGRSIPVGDQTGLRFILVPPQSKPGDPAILAVIVSLREVTWFFRVTGTVESIHSIEEDMDAFMKSVQFAEEAP